MEKMSSALMYSIFYLETFKITQGLSDLIISIIYFSLNIENEAALQDVEIFIKDNAYIKVVMASFLSIFVYYIVLKKRNKSLREKLVLKRIYFQYSSKVIACSVGCAMCLGTIAYLTQNKFPIYIKAIDSINWPQSSLLAVLSITIILPIFEEILFRGYIL
ncbi:hypothetical protein ACOAKC_11990 [Hathewaya histolytica]|uniref:hypothetical protein n=1 Tax=Hathewaya histolytica TaxID=1498 RepID=UPI003B66C2E1